MNNKTISQIHSSKFITDFKSTAHLVVNNGFQNFKFSHVKIWNSSKLLVSLLLFTFLFQANLYAQVTIASTRTDNSPPTGAEDGIIVPANVEYTINGGTWMFNETAKIEVQAGGHLIIQNNAVLTDNNVLHKIWGGIEETGNFPLNQYKANSSPNNNTLSNNSAWEGDLEPNQTTIKILAGCSVINALTGIKSTLGAVVRARGATFFDCEVGIFIDRYQDNRFPTKNACYVMDCNFIWNTINNNMTNTNLVGIFLNIVRGVNIGGCTFTNNYGTQSDFYKRSYGIRAKYSTFNLSQSGDEWCIDDDGCPENCYSNPANNKNNTFNNLFKGIFIETIYYLPIGIRNATFNNCSLGIDNQGSMGTVIEKCTFTASVTQMNSNFQSWQTNNEQLIHLNSLNCIDFNYFKNTFSYDGNNVWAIYVTGSGFDRSFVRKNTISNSTAGKTYSSNVNGLRIADDCTGLEAACNSFDNQGVDILISTGANCYTNQGTFDFILSPDGVGLVNSFSLSLSGRYNICIDYTGGSNYNTLRTRYCRLNSASGRQIPSAIGASDAHSEILSIMSNTTGLTSCDFTCSQLTKVHDFIEISPFKVYPNPSVDGNIKIDLVNNLNITTLNIFDAVGQKIKEVRVDRAQNVYEVNLVSKGFYFIQIIDNQNRSYSTKVLYN